MSIKVEEAYRQLRSRLVSLTHSEGEATAMARLIFHTLKGWDTTALVIHAADDLSDFTSERIENVLERLNKGEPLQYILGEARFYGLDLEVTPDTLIPRQETEELVELIVKDCRGQRDLRVLDVGTGSGAIAIALSRNLDFPEVTAIDFSNDAIKVAEHNAKRLHANIRFLHADIFTFKPVADSFDVIVSNPPYVMESEKTDMEKHVLEYEPHSALFVPDSDPLRFYRRIADFGVTALTSGGGVYFEINPICAESLINLLQDRGYVHVETHLDISRRQRFITARKP